MTPARRPPRGPLVTPFSARYTTCTGCQLPLLDATGRGVHPNPACDPTTTPWWTPNEMATWAAAHPTPIRTETR